MTLRRKTNDKFVVIKYISQIFHNSRDSVVRPLEQLDLLICHMIVPVAMTVIVEFDFSFTNVPNSKYDTVVLVMFNDTA